MMKKKQRKYLKYKQKRIKSIHTVLLLKVIASLAMNKRKIYLYKLIKNIK